MKPIPTCHIIQRQYLHVEVGGTESEGLALQRPLSDLCLRGLLPAIERVLDRHTPLNGDHLYVERLEIDVGILPLDRLEHDLAESVAQAVEKSLREQMEQILPRKSSATRTSENLGNVQHKTQQQSINEVFIYFLKTGNLPWWFRLPAGVNLEQVMLDSWQKSEKLGADAINEAALRTLASPIAKKRLIHQFSPVFLETLLSLLSPEGKKIMNGVLKALHSPDTPPVDMPLVDTKNFERQLWGMVFSNLARGSSIAPTYLVGETWKILPATERPAELAKLLERQWPDVIGKVSNIQTDIKVPNIQTEIEPTQRDSPASQALLGTSEHPDAAEGIYIENAGIVLLHPFLPRLFEVLGIAAGDKLLQPDRALCLLHFLVTGQSAAPEYELMLPKILCGIPLETPVESSIELTDAEKEEATALLEAVIRHWEALRNTSLDGLRGTFLIRAGKVSMREDGDWLLQVEAQTYDILLDQLPWSISMIKLPWMQRMLWVEWT